MSDWRLAWVKTRSIQGLAGTYKEVTAWKEAPPEMAEFMRLQMVITECQEYQSKPSAKPIPPDPQTERWWTSDKDPRHVLAMVDTTDSPPTIECAPLQPPRTRKTEDPR